LICINFSLPVIVWFSLVSTVSAEQNLSNQSDFLQEPSQVTFGLICFILFFAVWGGLLTLARVIRLILIYLIEKKNVFILDQLE
jgi:hypothetical protein